MYRIKEVGTGRIVAEFKTGQYEKAQEVARNIKKAEKIELFISSDGMRVWDTLDGDNVDVITTL